jgi:hypothetical protein
LKKPVKRWGIILGVAVSCVVIYYGATYRRYGAHLLEHGKAEYYCDGVLHRDVYPLTVIDGWWYIGINTNPHYANLGGRNLPVPFRCYYNGHTTLQFEEDGKVYLMHEDDEGAGDGRALRRSKLKVVEGEWSHYNGSEWLALPQFDGTSDLNDP